MLAPIPWPSKSYPVPAVAAGGTGGDIITAVAAAGAAGGGKVTLGLGTYNMRRTIFPLVRRIVLLKRLISLLKQLFFASHSARDSVQRTDPRELGCVLHIKWPLFLLKTQRQCGIALKMMAFH